MLNLPRQQQYIIILLLGALLVGGVVQYWRQQVTLQPPGVEELVAEDGEEVQEEPGEVVIHVAGAVVNQGVYRLPEGSRVIDALEAAGGGGPDGDIHALNQAALLVDGQWIYVPTYEEAGNGYEGLDGASQKINLNRATTVELETLPGIGPALAERIIMYRDSNGPFQHIEEIKQVSGIGDKRFEELKDLVTAP